MAELKLSKRHILFLSVCALLIVCGALAVTIPGGIHKFISGDSDMGVRVRDFAEGTRVGYEILADGRVVERGQDILEAGGVLDLPLPRDDLQAEHTLLDYKLRVTPPSSSHETPDPAETLELLLGLNRDTGDISLSGGGLEAFSDISVRKGDQDTALTTDWAGLFSTESLTDTFEHDDGRFDPIELAFQNSGIDRDFAYLGSGKIEILFGDPEGSNREAVRERYTWALRKMAEELSAVMVLQTEAIGMFFDARMQIKTQRKHQELQARAHKDYHPSEQMCRIGTFIRSVAHTESKSELNKHALNRILIDDYLAIQESSASLGAQSNAIDKINLYSQFHCDPRDENEAAENLCRLPAPPSGDSLGRLNKDIDYTRTLWSKLTLDVDFVDEEAPHFLEEDEADIVALAKNLYFPNIFELPYEGDLEENLKAHTTSRSFAAKMGVAHSSFLNIVGMKSRAPVGQETVATATAPAPPLFGTGVPVSEGGGLQSDPVTTRPEPPVLDEDAGWAYMKALLREFGSITDDEINFILGDRPSYYAQMEILTKKIYQHPNFYTNLYDKPANVDRIGASLDAIALMHQRDRFDSLLRREMLTSLLVEEGLNKYVEGTESSIFEQIRTPGRN